MKEAGRYIAVALLAALLLVGCQSGIREDVSLDPGPPMNVLRDYEGPGLVEYDRTRLQFFLGEYYQ